MSTPDQVTGLVTTKSSDDVPGKKSGLPPEEERPSGPCDMRTSVCSSEVEVHTNKRIRTHGEFGVGVGLDR